MTLGKVESIEANPFRHGGRCGHSENCTRDSDGDHSGQQPSVYGPPPTAHKARIGPGEGAHVSISIMPAASVVPGKMPGSSKGSK